MPLPRRAVPTGGCRGDGEVPEAVLGRAQDQLQPYGPVHLQRQRLFEPDVGQPYFAAAPQRGRGLQGHVEEGGAGQPDLTGDPMVGEIGEAAVVEVDVCLEEVPVGSVARLQMRAQER